MATGKIKQGCGLRMYGGSSPSETAEREHDFSKQLLTVSRISIQLAHNKLPFFFQENETEQENRQTAFSQRKACGS